MSLVKSRFLGVFGPLRIATPIPRSSKGCLPPIGFGRTNTSLSAVTIGRGSHKKTLGISSESVGRGGFLVIGCVFFLLVFFLVFLLRRHCLTHLLFDVFAVLDRPLLNSVWQQRILKILDIEDRRYNIYIKLDLLATFSLGPVLALRSRL